MLSQHAFLKKSEVPSREEWQKAIDKLRYDFQIDPELKPFEDFGFVPCKLNKMDSGFEINYEEMKEYLEIYPRIKDKIKDRDYCITFTWGSSMAECACVLIASLSLMNLSGAIIYYPNDDMFYEKSNLEADIKIALKEETNQ